MLGVELLPIPGNAGGGHHTMEFFEMCAALITQLARWIGPKMKLFFGGHYYQQIMFSLGFNGNSRYVNQSDLA